MRKTKHDVLQWFRRGDLGKADNQDDEFNVDLSEIGAVSEGYLKKTALESGSITLGKLDIEDEGLVDQVYDRAVQYAKSRSADLVSGAEDTTKDGIRRIISQGLEENIGRDAIADRLESAYEFSPQRAQLIADTEIGHANGYGSLQGLQAGEDAGLTVMKEWYPDDEACPICEENGNAGPIPLNEEFPSGDDAPLAHPNCECSLLGVVVGD